MNGLLAHCGTQKLDRAALARVPTPPATATHKPVPHIELVNQLEEALTFRHILVTREEFAVSANGARIFGVLDLDARWGDIHFSIGLRNANDKSMRLGLVAGYRVFVCDNMAFSGDFKPVFHKHTKRLELPDMISIAVDRIQRNFAPLGEQIEAWQACALSEDDAKLVIYDAFRSRDLRLPSRLLASVHRLYFYPEHEVFAGRTLWSLSNAFTSAFKELNPVPQFQATAKLGGFLERVTERKRQNGHDAPEVSLALAS